jgi:hypothetical protein
VKCQIRGQQQRFLPTTFGWGKNSVGDEILYKHK